MTEYIINTLVFLLYMSLKSFSGGDMGTEVGLREVSPHTEDDNRRDERKQDTRKI